MSDYHSDIARHPVTLHVGLRCANPTYGLLAAAGRTDFTMLSVAMGEIRTLRHAE